MSYDNKQYPNRKDWIRPYRKSGRFDRTCRPHGGCPWCENNRIHRDKKRRTAADHDLREFKNDE